jgi:hypothetical protein
MAMSNSYMIGQCPFEAGKDGRGCETENLSDSVAKRKLLWAGTVPLILWHLPTLA